MTRIEFIEKCIEKGIFIKKNKDALVGCYVRAEMDKWADGEPCALLAFNLVAVYDTNNTPPEHFSPVVGD